MFERLKSRKLWAMVVTAAITALNAALGSPIPEEMMTNILIFVGSYILGQSGVDVAKALKTPTTDKSA